MPGGAANSPCAPPSAPDECADSSTAHGKPASGRNRRRTRAGRRASGRARVGSSQPAGLPRVGAIQIDGAVFAFGLIITTAIGLIVGLLPALQASRNDPQSGLQQSSRTTAGGHQSNAPRARGLAGRTRPGVAGDRGIVLAQPPASLCRSIRDSMPRTSSRCRCNSTVTDSTPIALEPGFIRRPWKQWARSVGSLPPGSPANCP